MLRILLLIGSLTYMLNLGAQDTLSSFTYFNKVYGNDTSNWSSRVGLETNRGIFTIGDWAGIDTNAINVRLLNQEGIIEEILPFPVGENNQICFSGSRVHQVNDSIVVFINCYLKTEANTEDLDIHFAKVNSNGEILQNKVIANSAQRENPRALIPLNSGDYLIVGSYRSSSNLDTRFYLAKIDSEGNKLWENTEIAGDPGGNAVAFSAIELDNGNYLVGGYGYNGMFDNFDQFLVEIDQEGNAISATFLGQDSKDDCAARLRKLPSGNILLTSCYNDIANSTPLFFTELNQDLETVWEKEWELYESQTTFWTSVIVKENGSFLGVIGYENEEGWDQCAILQANQQGDIEYLIPISPNPNKHVYVHDMRPTKDGGYLITGYEHFPSPQRSWVLKVDSLFNTCSELGCDSTVYVIDSSTGILDHWQPSWAMEQSLLYPNPANDKITLKTEFIPDFQELNIYDLNGNFCSQHYTSEFSVRHLTKGLYLAEIKFKDGRLLRQKLMVN